MGSTALFGIIYGFHYTISANFYLYLYYFQQKSFQFLQNKRISNRTLISPFKIEKLILILILIF